MASIEKVSRKSKLCVTCDLWKGDIRNPSRDRTDVVFQTYQRGVCMGPLHTGEPMTPLNKCRAWRLWKKMNTPRTDEQKRGFFTELEELDKNTVFKGKYEDKTEEELLLEDKDEK